MIKKIFRSYTFIFIAFFLLVFQAGAQTGTLSPYSRYGIGELQFRGFAYQRAMGGIGAAIQGAGKLNFLNPASYASDTLTTAEIGADGMLEKLSDASYSIKKKNANLSYLSLGFPVVKKVWGLSIGIIPYSAIGYELREKKETPVDANYFYSGSGGINRFYLGNGFNIGKNFSVGFNASYLFGSMNRVRRIEFLQSGYSHNRYTNTITVSDIYLDYGMQYRFNLKNEYRLLAGISGSNSTKINATRNVLWDNYILPAAEPRPIDTVLFTENEKGTITFPLNFNGGLYLTKNNKWGIGIDMNYQNWSNYQSFGSVESLDKSLRAALGAQWMPDHKSIRYFNRAEYRLGGYFNKGFLELKNTSINDYGLTAGIGLPLRKSFQSMINISFEFGKRGTTADNLVQERYGRLFIGITFNEDWFHKRKYD